MKSNSALNWRDPKQRYDIFFGFMLVVIFSSPVFCLIYYAFCRAWYPNISERGQFGDSFGAYNAIVGTITTILLFINFFYERKRLNLEIEERQKREFEAQQNHTFSSFEKAFEVFKDNKNRLTGSHGNQVLNGVKLIELIKNEIKPLKEMRSNHRSTCLFRFNGRDIILTEKSNHLNENSLSAYFKALNLCSKYIYNLDEPHRQTATDLIKAHLTRDEIEVIDQLTNYFEEYATYRKNLAMYLT